MRLFTAIDIPEDMKDRLRTFLEPLRPLSELSWSRIENLHITTRFIGEWPEERLDAMESALTSIVATGPVSIRLRGLGWFPKQRNPRVFWAGVIADEALIALANRTEEAVTGLGVPGETRPYAPHLTLARVREAVALDTLRRALPEDGIDFGAFRAASFHLYLSRAGTYTRLAEYTLE
jgi:RNA 2',3'-cyclic 3'-phosphodiesterase